MNTKRELNSYRLRYIMCLSPTWLIVAWHDKAGCSVHRQMLLFGLSSTPLLLMAIGNALQWIMYRSGASWLCQYTDNFLTMGKAESEECKAKLAVVMETWNKVGVREDQGAGQDGVLEWDNRNGNLLVNVQTGYPMSKTGRVQRKEDMQEKTKTKTKKQLLFVIYCTLGVFSHACNGQFTIWRSMPCTGYFP